MFESKSINWRNGGKVEFKVGDTSRQNSDFDSLADLKAFTKPRIDQEVCQECSGALKGKFLVKYTKCLLYDSVETKSLFGKEKTKYILRETVFRLNGWEGEEVKCKSCKKTFLSEDQAKAQATQKLEKQERTAQREVYRQQMEDNKLDMFKCICKACDWKGSKLTWKRSGGCPRCHHGEYKEDRLLGIF